MTAGTREPGPMAVADDPTDPDRSLPAGRCDFSLLDLAAELPGLMPRAIERARGQVKLAQALGRFVFEHSPLRDLPPLQATEEKPDPVVTTPRPSDGDDTDPTAVETHAPEPVPEEPSAPVIPVDRLALPDYDSLSASQVIPRLQGLEPAELEDVRLYEASGRSRRTILNKIAQLQSS